MSHTSRIAVIGAAGWAGSRHVQAFHAQGAQVTALIEPSPNVHHFSGVDLFVEQAAAALRFAQGERPTVGYRQALRATERADQIVSMRRERP